MVKQKQGLTLTMSRKYLVPKALEPGLGLELGLKLGLNVRALHQILF